jgi:osmotically-inducible protein OsmY
MKKIPIKIILTAAALASLNLYAATSDPTSGSSGNVGTRGTQPDISVDHQDDRNIGVNPSTTQKSNQNSIQNSTQRGNREATTRSQSDLDLTNRIRQELARDSSISNQARNITISVTDGTVNLQGTARSELEKAEIERKVNSVAGVSNIRNELTVSNR